MRPTALQTSCRAIFLLLLACHSTAHTSESDGEGTASAAVGGDYKLYFKAPAGTVPEAYVWYTPAGGALQQPLGTWANTAKMLAVGNDWYVADLLAVGVPLAQTVGVIFKVGATRLSGGADLSRLGTGWCRMVNGAPAWSDTNPEVVAGAVTIFFKSAWSGAAPTIWVWEGTGTSTAGSGNRPISQMAGFTFPGPAMVKDAVQDWWSWTLPASFLPLSAGLHFKFAGGAQVNLDGAVTANEWFNGTAWSLSNPDLMASVSASPAGGTFATTVVVTLTAANPSTASYALNGGAATTFTSGQTLTLGAGMNPGEVATLVLTNGSASATYRFTKASATSTVVHVRGYTNVYYWNVVPAGALPATTWPGVALAADSSAPGWKVFTFPGVTSTSLIFNTPDGTVAGLPTQTPDLSRATGSWWYVNGTWLNANPDVPVTPVVTITPNGARSNTPVSVSLSSSNAGDVVYFTTNGTTPTTTSTRYTAPFSLSTSAVVKALGVNTAGVAGAVASASFVVDPTLDLSAPTMTANPPPGSYPSAQLVTFTLKDNAGGTSTAYYTTDGSTPTTASPRYVSGVANGASGLSGASLNVTASTTFSFLLVDAAGNSSITSFTYAVGGSPRTDFRQETIYFVITSRFFDGDPGNNLHAWDDATAGNDDSDPAWRGDFKGLIQKLDYIKALGFSAIWITPVVQNASGYDYHGYHASNFKQVDRRYLSADTSYQTLINAVHAKGMKLIQDVVFNHTSNFGEENLYPLFKKDWSKIYDASNRARALNADTVAGLLNVAPAGKLPANYDTLTGAAQYGARINAMKEDAADPAHVYHHEKSLTWEGYTVQTGQIAGDAVDLNTENPTVAEYLRQAYFQYIDQGVDAFRIDTVKHINRLTLNKEFIPQFKARGGSPFFMFGEVASRYRQVWNSGIPEVSAPFYTWKESRSYAWSATDRTVNEASTALAWQDYSTLASAAEFNSSNAYLSGNTYHAPDWSKRSDLDVIDFPMHWNFANAHDAFSVAVGSDSTYSDATFNVTYVESHDYAPDTAPETQRFALPQSVWAENLSLLFTFRGIPTLLYGDEVEFQKGFPLDVGPNAKLMNTGRAYFGDRLTGSVTATDFGKYTQATGAIATALAHPLAQHVRQLNLLRRAIPALQRGQYSTADISSASGLSFKRRYTDATTDSFALVTISGDATFSNVPNGTYVEAVTGATVTVSTGQLTTSGAGGAGNMRVYVLSTARTPAPGKVVDSTGLAYLH